MKRIFILILSMILLFSFISCASDPEYDEHIHAFSSNLIGDDSGHYYLCECGERKDFAEHSYSNWTYNQENNISKRICSVCGYEDKKEGIQHGVVISGVRAVENMYFETAEEAYTTVKAILEEKGGLGQDSLSDDEFDSVFSNGGKIEWKIYGEQKMIEDADHPYFLIFGRKAMHYSSRRHVDTVSIVGGNKEAKLICSSLTAPYEWWGENHKFKISFKNISLESIEKEKSLMVGQSYTDGIIASYDNCKIKGKLYCYVNAEYTLRVNNCEFDALDNTAYAIHVQGDENKQAVVNILNSTFKNSRGINIDQKTCIALIQGNKIVGCGNLSGEETKNYIGAIQISQGSNVDIISNTIENCLGNAIWLWSNKNGPGFKGQVTIDNNTITNCQYAFCNYNYTSNENISSSGNIITNTNVEKCYARTFGDDGTEILEERDALYKLK